MDKNYDFVGWATRNDIRCADGRIIRQDAFKECDGKEVPLVWNHQHNSPDNVLGHALLKNEKGGVRAYGKFNDTVGGQNSKTLVDSGDIVALSIYANNLTQKGSDVVHGVIREVSLVLAGANPGAYIDSIIAHGDNGDDGAAIIYSGENISLEEEEVVEHSEPEEPENAEPEEVIEHAEKEEPAKEEKKESEEESKEEPKKGKTVKEIFDEFTEEQKNVVYALIGQAVGASKGDDEEPKESEKDEGEKKDMKHNLFDNNPENEQAEENVITHAQMTAVISDANRYGTMKESALQHGIEGIDWLFPEDKNLNMPPEWINKNVEWVKTVLGGVHHSPFSRVKSMYADIREDEARAKGYIKGKQKKTEVFSLLKRSTSPQTIYKMQKFDRDDVIDITDFDVVSWVKAEMRQKLDEEIARAILIGDGRLTSDDDHISEDHVRPIYNDANLFTIKRSLTVGASATEDEIARLFERECVKARKDYRGSGTPTLFTTEDFLTTMLLREDNIGRRIHSTEQELATALRVSKIVTVPEMENITGALGGQLMGIIVNLSDYNVGADKGGAVSLFDDFDIDFNKMKYLIETRMSGALVKPYSAITIELNASGDATDYDPTGAKSRNVSVTKGVGDSTTPYPWEEPADDEEGAGE